MRKYIWMRKLPCSIATSKHLIFRFFCCLSITVDPQISQAIMPALSKSIADDTPWLEIVKLCCSPLGKASLDQFPESARISPPNEPFFRLPPFPSPRAAHQNHSLTSRLVAGASIAAVQGGRLEVHGSRLAWELSRKEGVRVGAEDGGSGLSTVSVASPESREEKLAWRRRFGAPNWSTRRDQDTAVAMVVAGRLQVKERFGCENCPVRLATS